MFILFLESSFTDDETVAGDKGPSISVVNAEHDNDTNSTGGSEVEGEDKKEDEKVNNGYVRVETKAVPTPQHPTKVVYPPDHIQLSLARHMDIMDTFSDDNSTRAELGSNPDERSILSDTVEQQEALAAVDTSDTEAEVNVKETTSTEVIVSPPTSEEEGDDSGTPQGVVVLSSPVGVTSTMSIVRPRSAPQSKLQQVLPADFDKCYSNHVPSQVMSRHQSQKSVPEAVTPAPKGMHKFSSLPAKSKYLGIDGAMAGTDGHAFTVLNSFRDSREAIDEIWKSVTLERSSQLDKTAEEEGSSLTNSPHSSHLDVSTSAGLAVNTSNGDVSEYHYINVSHVMSVFIGWQSTSKW